MLVLTCGCFVTRRTRKPPPRTAPCIACFALSKLESGDADAQHEQDIDILDDMEWKFTASPRMNDKRVRVRVDDTFTPTQARALSR